METPKPPVPIVAPPARLVHCADELDGCIRQGEIITDILQILSFDPATGDVAAQTHPYVIVAAQDCDLESDFLSRDAHKETGRLNGVLLYEAHVYDDAFKKSLAGGDIRKRVANNDDKRYHKFDAVDRAVDLCGEGLPELVIDFKKYFTLTPAEITAQIERNTARRRCRLVSPFLEAFSQRAAYYLSRVAEPAP